MRAVATCAGVDVALIYHHFGSKEELLEAVLSVPEGARAALRAIPVGTAEPGKAVVRVLVEMWENDPELRRQALAMVRTGLSNEHAAQRLRDLHTAFVLTLVAEVASERDRELRAALIGSHLAGLLLTRYLLRVPALASLDPEAVIEAAAPALAHYLTGDIAGESAVGKRTPAPARRRKRVSATPVERGRQRAEKLNGR
jgi:AcrR family transcriptional regulator